MHRLARKRPNKATVSQAQSTNYLHYPLEAQDPLRLLGLSSVQRRNLLLTLSLSLSLSLITFSVFFFFFRNSKLHKEYFLNRVFKKKKKLKEIFPFEVALVIFAKYQHLPSLSNVYCRQPYLDFSMKDIKKGFYHLARV